MMAMLARHDAFGEAGAGASATVLPILDLLRCPVSGEPLRTEADALVNQQGQHRYRVTATGIPLFAEKFCSADGRIQQAHYDRIAAAYVANLSYPHTQEYTAFLDRILLEAIDGGNLGTVAEICCGRGEAFHLLGSRVGRGIGVDVSLSMLEAAQAEHARLPQVAFVQGDATMLPLADESFDSVFMLGGIHHVAGRDQLFAEVSRILRPGGHFYFREPVSDFAVWRWIRHVVYRLSPTLDHDTERPLRWEETVPVLRECGLLSERWSTHGFFGFCLFMNSDVLVFNRAFRYLPGIRALTRWSTRLDELIVSLPGLGRAGLQVVGVAVKPSPSEAEGER